MKYVVLFISSLLLLSCVKELQIEKIETIKEPKQEIIQPLDTKEIDSNEIDQKKSNDPYFTDVTVKAFLVTINNKEYYLFQGQYDYYDILEKKEAEKLDPKIKDQNDYILTYGKFTHNIIYLKNSTIKWHYTNQFEKSFINEQINFIKENMYQFELKVSFKDIKTI